MLLGAAEAPNVHAVYLLPMTSGLDQFVATRLTTEGVLRVVTDPKAADAILTDRLGEGFEQKMKELYPSETEQAKADEKKDDSKDNGRPTFTSFGRGRGTIFLVDVQSRQVLWSTFEKPKDSTPEELNNTAGKIVRQYKKDFKIK
jgi:hypothetical protein